MTLKTSHGNGIASPPLDPNGNAIKPNKADISGLATGKNSDEDNDRRGSAREGTVQASGPKPHFSTISLIGRGPDSDPNVGTVYAAWSKHSPNYVPDTAFEPVLVDHETVIYGWLADVGDNWHPVSAVRRLGLSAGRVTAYLGEEISCTLADFGPDMDAARLYRARVAHYLSEAGGYEFGG